MPCELCQAIKGGEVTVFEDPHATVILHPRGAAPGHLLVIPRVHHSIMEQVPEETMRQLFRVAALMAASLEKSIAAKDLDVIIANGTAAGQEFPHFCIHLVPRGKGDQVTLGWEPAKLPEQEIEAIRRRLEEACAVRQRREERRDEEVIAPTDYGIRHVTRIP
jgi:histidine triad (HIT) family protein